MNFDLTTVVAVATALLAYFIKGFTGFGPALIMVPVLTLLFDPTTAIMTSTVLDLISGGILFVSVYRRLDWKFVGPMSVMLSIGTYFGAALLPHLDATRLSKIIGAGLLTFIVLLLIQDFVNKKPVFSNQWIHWAGYPVALISGFGGGLLGISGPVLVLYMKFLYDKTYFRDQLIGIFFFCALWRILLYRAFEIPVNIDSVLLLTMLSIGLIGLWIGTRLHSSIDEQKFNRVVIIILLIPAANLLFSM